MVDWAAKHGIGLQAIRDAAATSKRHAEWIVRFTRLRKGPMKASDRRR